MDYELHEAIATAADRVREAEERLVEKPLDSPEIIVEAEAAKR